MKYLKKYNESKSQDLPTEINEDLHDICLELEDEGFEITIFNREYHKGHSYDYHKRYMEISMYKGPNSTSVKICHAVGERTSSDDPIIYQPNSDILQDTLDRIKDYMSQKGYRTRFIIASHYIEISFNEL